MRLALPLLIILALSGCQTMQQSTPVANADEIVTKADWKNMETLTIVMGEHHYTPADLTLKAGKAYKLELKNEGAKDHYYTAPEFFKSVAWRKAMVNKQAEIKAPYFTAVEVLKRGGQLDLYFVPVGRGSYTVVCTIEDHRQQGMEGKIIVE